MTPRAALLAGAMVMIGLVGRAWSAERTPACTINMSRAAREASFTAVYSFATEDGGHPKAIRKVRDAFLSEDDMVSCLSGWSLPSFLDGGVIEFVHRRDRGWVAITISARKTRRTVRVDPNVLKTAVVP